MKKTKPFPYEERVAVSVNNLLLGSGKKLTPKQRRIVKKYPYGDYDKDLIINRADSNPTNPKEHGIISTIKGWFAPKPQLGAPLVKPEEYAKLTPEQQKKVEVVPTGPAISTVPTTGWVSGVTATGVTAVGAPIYVTAEEEKKKVEEVKKIEEAAKAAADKLRLGVPIVTAYAPTPTVIEAYKPPTAKEIKEAERIKFIAHPFKYIKEKVTTPLEKAQEKLTTIQEKIYYTLKPEERIAKERMEELYSNYEKGITEYNEEIKKFEGDIKEFEKKYIGRELPSEEYNTAVKKQEKLMSKSRELEESEKFWNEFREDIPRLEKKYEVKAKKIPVVRKVLTSFSFGVLTTPLTFAKLPLGLITKPKEVIPGVVRMPYELGKAVVERPLEAIPEMAGATAIFVGVTGAIRTAVTQLTAPKMIKIKPKVSQSFSFSDATRIGTTPEGISTWKVTGKIITKLKNPQTGKTIGKINTRTISDTIISPTKSGAIKSFSKSWAMSLKTGDISVITGQPLKIKMKVGLTKAKGELTLSPTEVEKLYEGYGRIGIREVGRAEVIIAPKKAVAKITFKPGKEFEALTNVWAKEIGVGRGIKAVVTPKKAVAITGREYRYMYKSLTDIYGKKGAEAIIKAREFGVTEAFVPEEMFIRFEPPKPLITIKARLPPKPKIKPPVEPVITAKPVITTKQLQQIIGMPEQAVAKVSAETITKSIGKILVGEVKPIAIAVPKVAPKVSPAVRAVQLISPAAVTAVLPRLREREINLSALNTILGMGEITRLREEQLTVSMLGVAQIQPQIQQQRQIQMAMQTIIAPIPAPIPAPTIHVPKVPPVPIPIIPLYVKIPKKEKERRRKAEKEYAKQQRAYQASVVAVTLGLRVPKKYKLPKVFTGLELRPMILEEEKVKRKRNNNYLKQINKIFT